MGQFEKPVPGDLSEDELCAVETNAKRLHGQNVFEGWLSVTVRLIEEVRRHRAHKCAPCKRCSDIDEDPSNILNQMDPNFRRPGKR